jgi:HTH-type transcriptional regulator/antitoxin HigA
LPADSPQEIPSALLKEELAARGMTQAQLARQMGRPLQAVNEIIRGKKRITGETALQLAEALGTSADFWMRLESDHELNRARLARQLRSAVAPARGRVRPDSAAHASRSPAR